MSTMTVFLKIDEGCVVSRLQEAVCSLDSAAGEVVLDFSTVRRIDSGGLRALEDLIRAADQKALVVTLRGLNIDVYKVLKLLKLTQRLSFLS
jgi:ABC-type transporter Mla MlaB component